MSKFRDAIEADLEGHNLPGASIKVDAEDEVWVLSLHQVGEWIQGLMEAHPESVERLWWVTVSRGGGKVLGPFASRDEALENRAELEKFSGRMTFWVWQEGER